jgi:hypothetical protein
LKCLFFPRCIHESGKLSSQLSNINSPMKGRAPQSKVCSSIP